jgi:hypothetical protein
MKTFMVLYKGSAPPPNASHEGWPEWFEKIGGALVDVGSPMTDRLSLQADGSSGGETTDLNGYSIIKAEDLPAARDLAKDHPYLSQGAGYTIEIFEIPKK